MASTDPLTGARQTVEQREAIESQQREGLLARIEGRLLAFQEQLSARGTQDATVTARVDALEQQVKGVAVGEVAKVAAYLSQREGNLVLQYTELRAEHEALKSQVAALGAALHAQAVGGGAPPVPVVREVVPAPAATELKTAAERRAEARHARDAGEAG